MKIGLVCPYNIFRGGGVQECVRALQAGLRFRGHDAYIITPLPREHRGKTEDGILFLGDATDVKSPFATTAQISFNASNEDIDATFAKYGFDILHFHEPWVPMVSRQLLTRSRSVNIATFHAKLPDTVMSKTIERVVTPYTKSVMKYLEILTAVSDAAAAYVRGLTDQAVVIVPNGIDLKKYPAITREERAVKTTILYVGRLEKRKGLKYLLKAFALLQARLPEARLIIAGDGPDRSKLEQQVEQLGLHHVTFAGLVTEEEKLRLMGEADIFCSPALYGESFGIVLLEAMAAGLPLVAGDNPGYSDVLQQRGKLSLINPRYSDEFARRLETFLIDDELRDIWRQWAEDYVTQFDYAKIIDQYEALYQDSLARKRP
jgi:phosphatidylinositol alpha-mannosyltransferase